MVGRGPWGPELSKPRGHRNEERDGCRHDRAGECDADESEESGDVGENAE